MSYLPCVGCGWCCLQDQCSSSMRRYGYQRRCPDLAWSDTDGRYVCQAMRDSPHAEEVCYEQHTGQGCCAPLNTWRTDVRNRG